MARPGSRVCIIEAETSIDDKNADGARSSTLLTPIPPNLTGSDACAQASASSLRLPRLASVFLMTSSNLVTISFNKLGVICTTRGFLLRIKGKFVRMCVLRVMMYGSETWPMRAEIRRMERTERMMIR